MNLVVSCIAKCVNDQISKIGGTQTAELVV